MKSKKTRERILDASLEMFNKKKASNVSTVQISAAMKISPGNLYYYYANKEDVIRCIWEERMSGILNELLKNTENIESAAELLDFLKDGLRYMIDYRFFYTEISTLFVNDEKLVETYCEVEAKMRDTFTALVVRLADEGKFISDDDAAVVLSVKAAVASAVHILNRYDVYAERGVTDDEFIGYSWIRIIHALDPILAEGMKQEIYAELEERGFSKKRFLELIK